ncbi:transmembrane protein 254-like [Sycon ciliatum]|uniref:transmembrane protein 254-like n=1 Tax=Sycon ciliatum TaxID=27933 RepID=UPI0020A8C469|eukprot:scpid101078/ scgid15087/ Transmembrane protein C10orf57 homolog
MANKMSNPADNHFRVPSLIWFLLLDGGMALLTIITFRPELIPYSSLGKVLGPFLVYVSGLHTLTLGIFYFAVVAHVGEALWALMLCRELNMTGLVTAMWTLQVFIVGFPALNLLRLHRSHSTLMGKKLQ